jgi:hypothetical protein
MVISSPEQVTPAWLTEALRESGHLDRGEVVAVRPAAGRGPAITGGPGFRPSRRGCWRSRTLAAQNCWMLRAGQGHGRNHRCCKHVTLGTAGHPRPSSRR